MSELLLVTHLLALAIGLVAGYFLGRMDRHGMNNSEQVTITFTDYAEHGPGWKREVQLSHEEVDLIVAALRENQA